jgi:predicted dehydrogenase
MAVRLAILGLDRIQHEWLEAVAALRAGGEIELVAAGHESMAAAREVGEWFQGRSTQAAGTAGGGGAAAPAFDDLRLLLNDAAPQVLLMDRPANATLDWLLSCVRQEIGIFSLGPPVESVAEAQALASVLGAEGPRTRLLYIWPRFADLPAAGHCAQADEFLRPVRFAAGTWVGINHALAKAMESKRLGPPAAPHGSDGPVRSLSVLAWDALGTLIGMMGMPTSVYAVVRGTVASGSSFADLTGAAAVTLRFADEAAASVTLCDRAPAGGDAPAGWDRRELLLWGAGGTLKLNTRAYEFRDADGAVIDAGEKKGADRFFAAPAGETMFDSISGPVTWLREFLQQYASPPSPHRDWDLRLEDVAATMEALVVSHRTGQAESPDRFRRLRR